MKNSKRGVTLVELVVSIAVVSMIIAAAVAVFFVGGKGYSSGNREARDHQNAAVAETWLTNALDTASNVDAKTDPADLEKGDFVVTTAMQDGKPVLCVKKRIGPGYLADDPVLVWLTGIKSISFTPTSLGTGASSRVKLSYTITAENGYQLFGGTVMNNCAASTLHSGLVVDLKSAAGNALHIRYPQALNP